ncbi:hypothetical protein HR45_07780 [Shewanella mangrovi]|uniref:DUF945 domain-containing protein n=1 Tax=Shewanella mangrovi TaxID=1515746 RepID=A0A094JCU7_9GAMM|nr:DUF945 family protein [Shewanella mangrovi]KFZ37750.1 hypothetical protein HR45_07780 [Shewanella mangrovi]
MKKVLLVGAVVIVGAVVAAPKFGSARFEQQLDQIVAKLNQYPGYSATVVSNQQGWFSADTTIKFGIDFSAMPRFSQNDALAAFPKLSFDTQLHTQFGPLLFSEDATLGWYRTELSIAADGLRDKLSWQAQQPLVNVNYTVSLQDAMYISDTIAPFTFKDETGQLAGEFSGYQGHGSWIGRALNYQGNAAALTLSGELEAKVSNIGMTTTADVNLAELLSRQGYDGKTAITVAAVDSNLVKVNKLLIELANSVDKDNDTTAVSMNYAADSVSYLNSTASDLALNITLGNIDNNFLRSYQTFLEQLYGSGAQAEALQQQVQQFMLDNLPQLLSKSPNLKMALHGKLPQGNLQADVDASIVDITGKLSKEQLANKQFWLQHSKAKFNAKADEDVANLLAAMVLKRQLGESPQFSQMPAAQQQQLIDGQTGLVLQQFIQQGLVTQDEGTFSISASLENGIANLNGLPIPL